MARVRRRGPAPRTARWTLELLAAALGVGTWEAYFGGPEEGRKAWERLASTYPSNPTFRCPVFWHYTEGVPFELRGPGEPVDDPELRDRRLRWLLGEGQDHLRSGETEWIRRELQGSGA